MPPSGNVGEALRYAPSGAGVLVEALRELATRGKMTSTSGTGSGKGAGARVAVRSVLEDHETAILELERQVDEIAKSVLDGSKEIQVLARAVKNLEQWSDEVAYRFLRPLEDRVTQGVHRQARAG